MATVYGRLGALDVTATTAQEPYVVPGSKHATVTINVCNRGSSSGTVRIAHMDATGTVALTSDITGTVWDDQSNILANSVFN